jgi:hypothetical protein
MVGHLRLLINKQTIPCIMGKKRHTDWMEWATSWPEWILENVGVAFENFVEQKWKDNLDVATAEPAGWEMGGIKPDKPTADTWRAGGTTNVAGVAAGEDAASSSHWTVLKNSLFLVAYSL